MNMIMNFWVLYMMGNVLSRREFCQFLKEVSACCCLASYTIICVIQNGTQMIPVIKKLAGLTSP